MFNKGGDTFQMLNTKNELEKLGVEVDIKLESNIDLTNYDIVHLFNIQNPSITAAQLHNAKRQGKKTVVSTIYWNMIDANKSHHIFGKFSDELLLRLLNNVDWRVSYLISTIKNYRGKCKNNSTVKYILNNVDLLLPNSFAELENIIYEYKNKSYRQKAYIVPNAVNPIIQPELDLHNKYILPNDFVLQVGRYEPIKNQLSVIKSLFDMKDIPLVFVGRSFVKKYAEEMKRLGDLRGNTYFFNEVSQDDLSFFYKNAKVHVLPSFRESPGLVTLEAANYGVNCVSTFLAPINEYFENQVEFCNPYSTDSIKEAILRAYRKKTNNIVLARKIKENYSWGIAAQKTLEAYHSILNKDI
jgi:glycosyltransferase involved in cell wall biosynthesis